MLIALTVTLPFILAAVLVASAIAKLRVPDNLAGWAELGVPRQLRQQWLLRLHPWAEIALGVALVLLGGWLGFLAALVAVALMIGYLWLVVRARGNADDASCACFGKKRPITAVTILRNAWLVILALASAVVVWATPIVGGAFAVAVAGWWGALLGAAAAAATATLVLWPDGAPAAPAAAPSVESGALSAVSAGGGDELDYIRTRTPAVPLTFADGTPVNLRELTMRRPQLVLAVSSTCGSCTPVIEKAADWRELLPELDVRLLFAHAHDSDRLKELTEPQSLHDADGLVRKSIDDWLVPSAVLFGIDGMLAGGPVTGVLEIDRFIDDVYESLHGERPVHA